MYKISTLTYLFVFYRTEQVLVCSNCEIVNLWEILFKLHIISIIMKTRKRLKKNVGEEEVRQEYDQRKSA